MAETVRNDELLEAVSDMREAYKRMHESGSDDRTEINAANSKVINITLRSTFIIPALIDDSPKLVQGKDNHLKYEKKPQARFMLVKHTVNGTFFPVFTDIDEFRKVENKEGFQPINMKFSDIATLTEQTPTVNGFVINPMSTNLPYTKDMLESIKQTLIEARDAKLKENEEAAASSGITMSEGGSEN